MTVSRWPQSHSRPLGFAAGTRRASRLSRLRRLGRKRECSAMRHPMMSPCTICRSALLLCALLALATNLHRRHRFRKARRSDGDTRSLKDMGVTDTNRAESIWVHEQNLLVAAIAYAHANMRIRSLNMRAGARRTDRNASRSSATDSYDASKGTAMRQPLLLQLLLLSSPQKELVALQAPAMLPEHHARTDTLHRTRTHHPSTTHGTPRRFLLLPIFIRT